MDVNFIEIGRDIGELVQKKNDAYGDAFAQSEKILKVLFPNGVPVDKYTDMLAIVRVVDKLFRIANRKDAFGENPWMDVSGYGLLGIANSFEDEKNE